jgi:hypothetical protein
MGGSGGGGTQTTQAEYPPEFRPLATAAVEQIRALQRALPLAAFAEPRPPLTAGVSPYQQAAMNLLPGLLTPTAGLQSLGTLGPSFAGAAQNALQAGQPTGGAQWALNRLAPGVVPLPNMMLVPGPTSFAPQTLGDVATLQAALQQPIPGMTPFMPSVQSI